jgi:hypothetical protein
VTVQDVEPPDPPDPPHPPTPGTGQIVVQVTEWDRPDRPIAGAEVWSQLTPTVKVKTDAHGYCLVNAVASGVCTRADGYQEIETCKVIAPLVVLMLHPIPPPLPPGRQGQVRAVGFQAVDDTGIFLEAITSFMWAVWGWQHDRDRMVKNTQAIRTAELDGGRILATVGVPKPDDSWKDRQVDCSQPNWASDVAYTVKTLRENALRTAVTIFGSVGFAPTPADRRSSVERVCDALLPFAASVTRIEIANEGWQNGFEGDAGAKELQQLVALARSKGPWLVAATAPRTDSCDSQKPYYFGSQASAITLHYDRKDGDNGWRYVRQPWREATSSCSGFPTKFYCSGEPMEWFGKGDTNLLRMMQHFIVTWQTNNGSLCLHTGAGIRGGGSADVAVGRAANFWEVPQWNAITSAIKVARANLAKDFSTWQRGDSEPTGWKIGDWSKVIRWYESRQGKVRIGTPHGITGSFTAEARVAQQVEIIHPVTWQVLSTQTVLKGQKITLNTTPTQAYVIRSREL